MTWRTAFGIAVLATVVVVDAVWAQSRRLDTDGNLREDAYIRLPLSAADQRYASIDGAKMKRLLTDITDISLANRNDRTRYWGRIAGTRGEAMALSLIHI